ncbi:MAG: ACP S-malonyltransferase [Gammaproteobacteria bacterium]|nr:ACP S-malonyltransferase [Gammaproteobacteria bacterium]
MNKLAFVFPGQGSQFVGMLNGWEEPTLLAEMGQLAKTALHEDLEELIRHGPQEKLALTAYTQPCMLLADCYLYQLWGQLGGPKPAFLAGHSLGEYAALVAGGYLDFSQALQVVRYRGQCMQEAVPVGSGKMAAILGLEVEKIIQICQMLQGTMGDGAVLEVANYNDPWQTVLSGTSDAIEQACLLLKDAGAKRCLILPVSAPFHCALMRPAADKLLKLLHTVDFFTGTIPVVNNVDVHCVDQKMELMDSLYRQAFHSVRWVETIQYLAQQGVEIVVECGPGQALTNMGKRIAPDLQFYSLKTQQDMVALIQTLNEKCR